MSTNVRQPQDWLGGCNFDNGIYSSSMQKIFMHIHKMLVAPRKGTLVTNLVLKEAKETSRMWL